MSLLGSIEPEFVVFCVCCADWVRVQVPFGGRTYAAKRFRKMGWVGTKDGWKCATCARDAREGTGCRA